MECPTTCADELKNPRQEINLSAKLRGIYAFQLVDLRAHSIIVHQTRGEKSQQTHPLPVQEEAERRRRRHAILARDRLAHAHSQVDLRERDFACAPPSALGMREILERRLDHPTRAARRGREHGHDGAVRLEQAAERRRVRRDVDRARDRARRRRAVTRVQGRPRRRAIRYGLEEGR